METHAHDLHKAPGHGWKHYFFEFFMLFLAVFCGFLAENWREQLGEHNHEKEYMHSLVGDIKSDTLLSNKVLIRLNRTMAGIDSVMETLSSPETINNSNNAFRLWSKNLGFADFIYNDGTMQQLKNSGGLRLIRNKAVADSILKYDLIVRNFYAQADLMNRVLGDQHIYSQLFDFISLNRNKNIPVPLTEQGKRLVNEAYANRKVWSYGMSILIERLKDVNKEGKSILTFIKEQYQLE
jgi:hypothetical protein